LGQCSYINLWFTDTNSLADYCSDRPVVRLISVPLQLMHRMHFIVALSVSRLMSVSSSVRPVPNNCFLFARKITDFD